MQSNRNSILQNGLHIYFYVGFTSRQGVIFESTLLLSLNKEDACGLCYMKMLGLGQICAFEVLYLNLHT